MEEWKRRSGTCSGDGGPFMVLGSSGSLTSLLRAEGRRCRCRGCEGAVAAGFPCPDRTSLGGADEGWRAFLPGPPPINRLFGQSYGCPGSPVHAKLLPNSPSQRAFPAANLGVGFL
jgi:hypothetical protein